MATHKSIGAIELSSIGIGYEIRLSPAISFTPYFSAVIGLPIGDLNYNGEPLTDGVSLAIPAVCYLVTWAHFHPGPP